MDTSITARSRRSAHADTRTSPGPKSGAPAPAPGVAPSPQATIAASDRLPGPVWVIAAVFVAAEVAVSGRYGFMQDELYFLVAGTISRSATWTSRRWLRC